mgnify:CR=1 FL=1
MKREIGDFVEDVIDAMDKALQFVEACLTMSSLRIPRPFLLS